MILLMSSVWRSKSVPSQSRYLIPTEASLMAYWHGNALHISDPLWGESTNYRWIPLAKGQQYGNFRISTLPGCTITVKHNVEVPSMGDPIWIRRHRSPGIDIRFFKIYVKNTIWRTQRKSIHVNVKPEWGVSTNFDEVENFLHWGFLCHPFDVPWRWLMQTYCEHTVTN